MTREGKGIHQLLNIEPISGEVLIKFSLYEDETETDNAQKSELAATNGQTIRFSIESATNYKFLDNANLSISYTAGRNITNAEVRFLSDYVIEVYNLDVGGTNK